MAQLTADFWEYEFACPCCGEVDMDPVFMYMIQALRTELDIPFAPVEGGGYRCKLYGSENTSHRGNAIDPDLAREHYHEAMRIAFKLGFTGIGVKQKKGKFQLHLDNAVAIPGVRPRPWVWTY